MGQNSVKIVFGNILRRLEGDIHVQMLQYNIQGTLLARLSFKENICYVDPIKSPSLPMPFIRLAMI